MSLNPSKQNHNKYFLKWDLSIQIDLSWDFWIDLSVLRNHLTRFGWIFELTKIRPILSYVHRNLNKNQIVEIELKFFNQNCKIMK